MYVSIDVGEKNLGWTVAYAPAQNDIELSKLMFRSGVYDFKPARKVDVVTHRVKSIIEFFDKLIGKTEVYGAVIERQVNLNQAAMQMMYSIATVLHMHTDNVSIFDPKRKFIAIGQQYDTKNKKHKKQSIANMRKMITYLDKNKNKCAEGLATVLFSASKGDDIADSFNQLIIQLQDWNKLAPIDLREIYNKDEEEDD